ncbi:MAG: cytochrome P450 [Gammaproteobacteria bacterium]
MQLVEGHLPLEAPAGVASWDIDPYATEVLLDPQPYYHELRQRGPFVYIPKYEALACGGYAETREIFSDPERFVSSRGVGLSDFAYETPWRPPSIVLEVDPPRHTQTRTVLNRALSPVRIAAMGEAFAAEADDLIDGLLEKGEFEGIAELAEAFPTTVFPKAVGLRNIDRRRLIDYGTMVFNALGPDNRLRRDAMAAGADIVPWIMQQCARAQLEPEGFGAAIYAAADAGDIAEEEAGMLVRSLLSAGIDTTVTAIGNALWCLANAPEQYAKLVADPSLARATFEEVLRLTSPVHTFCRTAVAATTVAGVPIPANTKLLCVLGAANLDPARWSDAETLDITRKTTGHLAFGVGIHACVGQNIARAEGVAVLKALAHKVAHLAPAGPAEWRPNNAVRGLKSLPLRMAP